MKNHKTVEIIIIVIDDFYQFCPVSRFHVRRVERGIELVGGNAVVESFQFGDVLKQMIEVEIF